MMDRAKFHAAFNAYLRGEWPSGVEVATSPRLSNWKAVIGKSSIDQKYCMRLAGTITGHPNLSDGLQVETSPVLWADQMRGLARTMSRVYCLGRKADSETTSTATE